MNGNDFLKRFTWYKIEFMYTILLYTQHTTPWSFSFIYYYYFLSFPFHFHFHISLYLFLNSLFPSIISTYVLKQNRYWFSHYINSVSEQRFSKNQYSKYRSNVFVTAIWAHLYFIETFYSFTVGIRIKNGEEKEKKKQQHETIKEQNVTTICIYSVRFMPFGFDAKSSIEKDSNLFNNTHSLDENSKRI